MRSASEWMAVFFAVVLLTGCSAKTVYFEGYTETEVQLAYEHIFYPPRPSHASNIPQVTNCFVQLDFNMSGVGDGVSKAYESMHRRGIRFHSSEKRWTNNRYEKSFSVWWLIFLLQLESETAVTEPAKNGTNLRIEIYPADDELLEKRFQQVQSNLEMLPKKQAAFFNSI